MTYTEHLAGLAGVQLPVEEPWARQVYWMFGVVLDKATGLDAVELAKRLKARGIETRPFFLGMHEQPVFHRALALPTPALPCRRTNCPARPVSAIGPNLLTEAQIDTVCAALVDVLFES